MSKQMDKDLFTKYLSTLINQAVDKIAEYKGKNEELYNLNKNILWGLKKVRSEVEKGVFDI